MLPGQATPRAVPAWPDPYADVRAEARLLRIHRQLAGAGAATAAVGAVASAGGEVAAALGAWLTVAGLLALAETSLDSSTRWLHVGAGAVQFAVGLWCLGAAGEPPARLAVPAAAAWLTAGAAVLLAATFGRHGGWVRVGGATRSVLALGSGAASLGYPSALPVVSAVFLSGSAVLFVALTWRASHVAH